MKVAVTGATGFVGRYTVAALLEHGHDVVCLGRDQASLRQFQHPSVRVFETDYSKNSLDIAFQDIQAIIHLAGRRSTREDGPFSLSNFTDANLKALENLFLSATQNSVTNFVFASSIAAYSARNQSPYREQDIPHPVNNYGLSKLLAEQCLDLWARNKQISITNLRLAAIFGYGERNSAVLMKFVGEAMEKRPLILTGNTAYNIDQIYIRDVTDAFLASLDNANPGGIFNIGAGQGYSVAQIAESINEVFGNTDNVVVRDPKTGKVSQNFMDIERAKSILGWSPRWGLDRGLKDFLATATRNNQTGNS